MRWRVLVLAAGLLALPVRPGLAPVAPPSALAAEGDTPEIADQLQLVVLKREILAIDARGGSQITGDLEIGEEVQWTGTRGRVGVALTDRRLLAVSTRSASWQSVRYRRTESVPDTPLLGARVALAATRVRLIGFDGGSGNLLLRSIGPNESLVDRAVDQNVAVAVTDRRVLGLSPFRGGFFEASLRLGERYEGVTTASDSATVQTSERLLIFRAPTGTWEQRDLDLN